MPGLLKIGQTATDPEGRRRELQDTGVPLPFELEYSIYIEDYESVERAVHQRLGDFRAASNREFFQLPLNQAVRAIKSVCEGTEFVVVVNYQKAVEQEALEQEAVAEYRKAVNFWKGALFIWLAFFLISLAVFIWEQL